MKYLLLRLGILRGLERSVRPVDEKPLFYTRSTNYLRRQQQHHGFKVIDDRQQTLQGVPAERGCGMTEGRAEEAKAEGIIRAEPLFHT